MTCENPIDHRKLTLGMVHGFANWEVSSVSNLDSIETAESDLHKVAYVTESGIYYGLISFAPAIWHPISGSEVVGFTYSNSTRTIKINLSSGVDFEISISETINALSQAIQQGNEALELELKQYVNTQINTLSDGISDQIALEVSNNIGDEIQNNYLIALLERNSKDLVEIEEEDNGELILWDKDARYYLRTSTTPFELNLPSVTEDIEIENPQTLEIGGYIELLSDVTASFTSPDSEAIIHDLRPELDDGVLRTDKLLLLDISSIPDPSDPEEELDQPIWILTSSNFEKVKDKVVTWDEVEDKPELELKLKDVAESLSEIKSENLSQSVFTSGSVEVASGLDVGFNVKLFALGDDIEVELQDGDTFSNLNSVDNHTVLENSSVELVKLNASEWWIE